MTTNPTKMFPCSCGGDGLVIVREDTEEGQLDYIEIGFWAFGQPKKVWGWKDKIRWIWYLLWHETPYSDMVEFSPDVAKNFANHILYVIGKNKVQEGKAIWEEKHDSTSGLSNLVLPDYSDEGELDIEDGFAEENIKKGLPEGVARLSDGRLIPIELDKDWRIGAFIDMQKVNDESLENGV